MRQRQPPARPRGLAPVRLEPLEARLVLVHLAELAMAPVALDELALALDRLGLGLGILGGPGVALVALAVVRAVVAAERRQPAVAQLPDPRDRGVEEGAVVRRDEQRAGPAPEVVLEPLEGVEVQVVRGFVEEEQVRVGDDEPGERRARLLPAGQGAWRLGPLVAGEAEAAERRIHPLVEGVAAQHVEPVLEIGVGRIGDAARAFERGELGGHRLEVGRPGPDGGPQVRARP